MHRRLFLSLGAVAAVATIAGDAAAQSTPQTRMRRAYRDDLMTGDERGTLDRDLRNARTDRERARIENEHRARMNQRAGSQEAHGVEPYRAPANGWSAPGQAPAGPAPGIPDALRPRRRAARTATGLP